MKVAIIGAGVAGLSCAYELERNGITPVVFEKRSYIGDPVCNSCINPRLFNRPVVDSLAYLRGKYNISIKPLSPIKKVVMRAPNKSVVVGGKLGYILKKGPGKDSIEYQIASHCNPTIVFDHFINIEDIKNDFSHIVVATGSNITAKKRNVWTDTFTAMSRYAIVSGSFATDTAAIWLNNKYAKNTFAYLLPSGPKEASLALVVNGITHDELDFYWKEFLFNEDIPYKIIETRDSQYFCGFVNPHKVENLYFAGNAGGFTDDLLGVGVVNAIETGVLAGRAIAWNLDYDKLVEPIFRQIKRFHELRKAMNTFDNRAWDRFISFLGKPVIKQLIYNNPFFNLSHAAPLIKLYNKAAKASVEYRL